jgi:hypothetical protein
VEPLKNLPPSKPVVKREMRNSITTFFPNAKPHHDSMLKHSPPLFFFLLPWGGRLGIPEAISHMAYYYTVHQYDNRASRGKEVEKSGSSILYILYVVGRQDEKEEKKNGVFGAAPALPSACALQAEAEADARGYRGPIGETEKGAADAPL